MAHYRAASSALHVLILLAAFSPWQLGLSQSLTGADCRSKQRCGDLNVTYPFKLQSEPNCPSFSPFFHLDCLDGQLFLQNLTTQNEAQKAVNVSMRVLQLLDDSLVLDVSSLRNEMTTLANGTCASTNITVLGLPTFPGPFIFAEENLFGSFGCTMGLVIATELLPNSTAPDNPAVSNVELGGCPVVCQGNEDNQKCDGRPCCSSNLPIGTSFRGLLYLAIASPFTPYAQEYSSTPCQNNYATPYHPNYTNFSNQTYGLKLKWALPTSSIMDIQNSSNFACSKHTTITIVQELPGYRCSCQHGFDGDGYSLGSGCSDINECIDASLNDCIPGKSTCHNNVEGSYECKCNARYHVGDGLRNGSSCKFSPTLRNILTIIGAVVFVGVLIAGLLGFAIRWKRKIKRRYFLQNGGAQFQDVLEKAGAKQELKRRIFTESELNTATDNYADHAKLGMGGFGTVYKGVLADGTLVAIKKANRSGEGGNSEFLNELQILMQINHRNIVRLLGCCLETAVPLLVYEFVAHGTVRENLDLANPVFTSWAQRLKVARQTAEALAYLHAAASPPILHRDVKSANVLLNDDLDAKVADFGASRLLPDGAQHLSTAVQGTIGYLDPEYFQTLQLTAKSDVYSLGVMLVELITGLKPVDSQNREPDLVNLALLFIHRMQEGREEELFDSRLKDSIQNVKSGDPVMVQSSVMAVAKLARQCLALSGVDRPSMSLLADELRHLSRTLEDGVDNDDVDEYTPLVPCKSREPNHHEGGAVI